MQTLTLDANGEQVLGHSVNETMDLRSGINEVRGAQLSFPESGHYEIKIMITHHSIEGGSLDMSETVMIPTIAPA